MRLFLFAITSLALSAGEWSAPAEIRSDDELVVSYRGKADGGQLVIKVLLKPGWHTFAMDNTIRADEKLAGKKALAL